MAIEIAAIIALCKLAAQGGNKALEAYKKTKFSNFEKELLAAAADNGEFFIVHVDEHPGWIKYRKNKFP